METEKFSARLIDLTARDRAEEEAQFPMADVSDDDRPLVVAGAVFRWTIGLQRLPGGTKQRISQLVFRRLPMWTKTDIARADNLAAQWAQNFNGVS